MKMLYLNDRCKSFLLITSRVYTYVFVPCPRTKCLEDDDEIRVFSKFCTLSTRNFLITGSMIINTIRVTQHSQIFYLEKIS